MPDRNWILGLFVIMAVVGAAQVLHGLLPNQLQSSCGEASLALVLGMFLGNAFTNLRRYNGGYKFCLDTLLKTAIVLVGLRISLEQIATLGLATLALVTFTMSFALACAYSIGRWLGVPPRLAALIGIGVSVCGNTAISATAPAIGASDEEMSFAIVTNTIFGTLAVIAYPILAQLLALSDSFFGFWSGLAVNDTSQVIASSFAYSEDAGNIATTIKLTRNSLMGCAILFVTWTQLRGQTSLTGSPTKTKFKIPSFVLAFLVVAIANASGLFEWVFSASWEHVQQWAKHGANLFIVMALAGVGLNTNFRGMRKIGWPPFILGLCVASCTSMLVFFFLSLTPFLKIVMTQITTKL